MPIYRFYFPNSFNDKTNIILNDKEAYHAKKVLRLRSQDQIEIINNNNQIAKGLILEISFNEVKVKILEFKEYSKPPSLCLFQNSLRQPKRDLILEKGTELGFTHFFFFENDDCPHISETQKTRCEYIVISAVKQCGRYDIPEIQFLPSLLKTPKQLFHNLNTFFCDPHCKESFSSKINTKLIQNGIAFIIGPEPGFSYDETEYMKKTLKAEPILLHPYILKAETAPLVAATLAKAL